MLLQPLLMLLPVLLLIMMNDSDEDYPAKGSDWTGVCVFVHCDALAASSR